MKITYIPFILLLTMLPMSGCSVFKANHAYKDLTLDLQPAWQTGAVFDNPQSIVFDPVAKILIVSNANGPAMKRDGNGYLSKVALNGVVLDQKWLTGLDAPKGMALHGNTLYVADIRSLAVVDLSSGLIKKIKAKGAKFLDDIAVDRAGRVFISDLYTDTIYVFEDDQLQVWLRDKRLASPNGLYVEGDTLYVGSWGVRTCGMETAIPGHLLQIDLHTKKINDLGENPQPANIDGVEGLGSRGFLMTDRVQGLLLHLNHHGELVETISVGEGAADLHYLPEDWELVVVPMVKDNVLKAFTLPVQ